MDTIFALATAAGRAGVAVIRISGPRAFAAAQSMMASVPVSRGVRRLVDRDGTLVDTALVLRFAGGGSFTGEDVIELHTHGSPAVIQAVLGLLDACDGLRHAAPGEFTRRAMENGKLDLTQVEGLADLIDAETDSQRRQALRVLSGALGERVEGWRTELLRATALLEAMIDFADEDLPTDTRPAVLEAVQGLRASLQAEFAGVAAAERIRSGFEVAIVGAPNAGKSTLLNRIAGRDAAITSSIAGTTRDVIEVRFDLKGLPVTFLDTAGLRESTDEIEQIGIALARKRAVEADLRIHLVDTGRSPELEPGPDDLVVITKDDSGSVRGLSVSGLNGYGVDHLLDRIHGILASRVASIGVAIRDRHRVAIGRAIVALDEAIAQLMEEGSMVDLIADDLRIAARALDSLLGRIDVEEVLGEIFSRFCVGK